MKGANKMRDRVIYTPGPTEVRENVRLARANATTNPDLDIEFVEFYKTLCDKLARIMKTENEVYILSGEGILGLEAACASLTEQGDRVLVIDNGIFGKGFKDFVKMYGGEAICFSSDYNKEVDIRALKEFLNKDSDFKYATIVHCDTPTGVLNNISEICPLLKSYGIATVVDTVAAMVGEPLKMDEWQVDIAIGGSQKAISAPSGLTVVGISEDAKKLIKNRKTPVVGFYCNLLIWENYYKEKWFPYTMPISDINGLDEAINNILEEGIEEVLERHKIIGNATREALKDYGLKLYLKNGYSNTVTAVEIPEEIGAEKLKNHLLTRYNLMMSTSLDEYKNKVLRIGHMGENARVEKITCVLDIIDKAIKDLGFKSEENLLELFNKHI